MEYIKNDKESLCMECGDPIVYGRTDKKFCCEQCKNRYNNRRIRNSRAARLRVIHGLDKNYLILESLLRDGQKEIGLAEIQHLGFDLNLITSVIRGRRISDYSCFDICFKRSDSRLYDIRKVASFIIRKADEK